MLCMNKVIRGLWEGPLNSLWGSAQRYSLQMPGPSGMSFHCLSNFRKEKNGEVYGVRKCSCNVNRVPISNHWAKLYELFAKSIVECIEGNSAWDMFPASNKKVFPTLEISLWSSGQQARLRSQGPEFDPQLGHSLHLVAAKRASPWEIGPYGLGDVEESTPMGNRAIWCPAYDMDLACSCSCMCEWTMYSSLKLKGGKVWQSRPCDW